MKEFRKKTVENKVIEKCRKMKTPQLRKAIKMHSPICGMLAPKTYIPLAPSLLHKKKKKKTDQIAPQSMAQAWTPL